MTKIDIYKKYIDKRSALLEELKLSNYLSLPRISSVTVFTGVGKYRGIKDRIDEIKNALSIITGQKPSETISRNAISNFKLRRGEVVGLKVTLRGKRMYAFLDRLINVTLPRNRELKAINIDNFDGQGNLNIGFKDTASFAEITYDNIDSPFGLNVTISIKQSSREKSLILLEELGFPVKGLGSDKIKG